MYESNSRGSLRTAKRVLALALSVVMTLGPTASAQPIGSGSVVRKIEGPSDKLEITTNTSRILTLDKKIPKVQVNNPELLAVTPLSATEIQVSAKKAGVTQVNLWDEDGDLHTVDVFIYGDVRELEHALATQFPNSSIRVYRYSQSLVLTGFIDRPDYVDPIRQIAEDYAPKVINNIAVGGVQQVLLKVKIYEVSRTKLRKLSSDFAVIGEGGYFGTSVSGLISNVGGPSNPFGFVTNALDVKGVADTAGQTVEFAVTDGNDALVGFLDTLQQKDIAKILAEPNIVAVSGRPAYFNEGGEIPVLTPQSLGNVAIEYKPFGTQVDFLPIVLGNGKIRLEVRPRISDLDPQNGVDINNIRVPGLKVREVETAVEMNAGQTFAIAGLIQQRTTAIQRGIPLLMDIPILGVPFRSVSDEVEEVELLILVTPELVDALEPHQVPPCGPGMGTVSPKDGDLYCDGKIEVPDYCSPCANGRCGGCPKCNAGGFYGPPAQLMNPGMHPVMPHGGVPTPAGPVEYLPQPTDRGQRSEPSLPTTGEQEAGPTLGGPSAAGGAVSDTNAEGELPAGRQGPSHFAAEPQAGYVRQTARPYQPAPAVATDGGLIGPVGYEE